MDVEQKQDMINRLDRLDREFDTLQATVIRIADALDSLIAEFRQTRPMVLNCPKCHRKIGAFDKSCGMCGHVWAQ